MSNIVELYTDGACKGNPGRGGWGSLLRYRGHERELYGGETLTTNNRMELMAVIKGLEALQRSCRVLVVTDSQYVKQGITEWIIRWRHNGWRTADKQPVKNRDLWEKLDSLITQHQIDWQWIRGHAGHPENERVDRLANQGALDRSSIVQLADND